MFKNRYLSKIVIFILTTLAIFSIIQIIAYKKKFNPFQDDDLEYNVVQKNWEDLDSNDLYFKQFYNPFVINMNFLPDDNTMDELNESILTFMHSEPINFAIPQDVLRQISSEKIFFTHKNDKLLIHSQYTIAVQLIPPILFEKINLYEDTNGNDNNDKENEENNSSNQKNKSKKIPDNLIEYLEDISEFFNIIEISQNNEKIPRPLQINIYPNNFIFIPREWGFRFLIIKEYEEQTNDGLVEFFVYKTIFSKLLN